MSNGTTPIEVFELFLRVLSRAIHSGDRTAIVLRGSLLLHRWFGSKARPPADVDLECFHRRYPGEEEQEVDEEEYDEGDYALEDGKAICRYAASAGITQSTHEVLAFLPMQNPHEGQSLWDYGTAGERHYVEWSWRAKMPGTHRLQIDISTAGAYGLDQVGIEPITFSPKTSAPFQVPGYSQEMMLATKLSWLMRSFTRRTSSGRFTHPLWKGDPKDLFDAHLLLTHGELRPAEFQKSLLAVGESDKLDWMNLEALFDVREAPMIELDFHNWPAFAAQHSALIACGPVEMLRTIADRLEPLLGEFRRPEEVAFLSSTQEAPPDEASYLIYADWLEERRDPRADFLRLFVQHDFHADELSPDQRHSTRKALAAMTESTPLPWLFRLFGNSPRFRQFQTEINR